MPTLEMMLGRGIRPALDALGHGNLSLAPAVAGLTAHAASIECFMGKTDEPLVFSWSQHSRNLLVPTDAGEAWSKMARLGSAFEGQLGALEPASCIHFELDQAGGELSANLRSQLCLKKASARDIMNLHATAMALFGVSLADGREEMIEHVLASSEHAGAACRSIGYPLTHRDPAIRIQLDGPEHPQHLQALLKAVAWQGEPEPIRAFLSAAPTLAAEYRICPEFEVRRRVGRHLTIKFEATRLEDPTLILIVLEELADIGLCAQACKDAVGRWLVEQPRRASRQMPFEPALLKRAVPYIRMIFDGTTVAAKICLECRPFGNMSDPWQRQMQLLSNLDAVHTYH